MATFTINTRNHGPATFFVRDSATAGDSGYVYLEAVGKPGTLGKQICAGGDFSGETLTATVESLEKVARAWHRKHLQIIADYNIPYGN